MLPVAVDCSFPGGIAMRYALSVSGLVDDVKFSHYGGMYNSKNSRFHTSIRQRRLEIERKLHYFTRQWLRLAMLFKGIFARFLSFRVENGTKHNFHH